MTKSSVCVDASLVVKLVVTEPDSQYAAALWEAWVSGGFEICAPKLLPFEVASAVRKQVKRGIVSTKAGAAGLATLIELIPIIKLFEPSEFLQAAWRLGETYNLTVLYDAYYVALAEQLDTQLWTGDARMLRTMPQHASRIKALNPTT